MRSPLIPLSFLTLIVALAAWAGVWFLFSDISARLDARAQLDQAASAAVVQKGNALALHALVSDTALERASLDASVDTDVVGIANQIQAAGQAAGVQTTIGSASLLTSFSSQSGVNELEFVVQSTGSFAQVWDAAQLFETLPLPSSVSELDLEQMPGAQSGSWQLTAHIDVVTGAQISS